MLATSTLYHIKFKDVDGVSRREYSSTQYITACSSLLVPRYPLKLVKP
jgi:hypothetical protein